MALLPIVVFIVFSLPFLGFLLLVYKLVMKSKNSSWSGEIVDKAHNEKRDFDNPKKMEHFYYIEVSRTEGRNLKVGLSEEMWKGFEIGDKVKKDKGKLYPEKI